MILIPTPLTVLAPAKLHVLKNGSPCYGGPNNGTAPSIGTYPRLNLMPSGFVVTCGGQTTVRSWDPATGKWAILTQTSTYRHYGVSFLLPLHNIASERGKILLAAGALDGATFATQLSRS